MYGYGLDFSKRTTLPNNANWCIVDFSEPVELVACGMRFFMFKSKSGVIYSVGKFEIHNVLYFMINC